jgi:hypothetical protein
VSSKRILLAASLLGSVLLATPARADLTDTSVGQHVWFLGSAGLGGGSSRMGAFHATAAVEAHVWCFHDVAFGAAYGGVSTGEPDGGGGAGSYGTFMVTGRIALPRPMRRRDTAAWIVASLGVGAMHLAGYDDSNHDPKPRYDVTSLLVTSRIGFMEAWTVLSYGISIDVQVMGKQGYSIAPNFMLGFVF